MMNPILLSALPAPSSDEMEEVYYRKGYRDGWIEAAQAMEGLLTRLGVRPAQAFQEMEQQWRWELRKWAVGDCSARVEPPRLHMRPTATRRRKRRPAV